MEYVACNLCGADNYKIAWEDSRYRFRVVVCKDCGLAYLNPRMTTKEAKEFYTRYIRPFPDNYLNRDDNNFLTAAKNQFYFLKDYINVSDGQRVLEIGSSYGFFLHLLKQSGWETYGVEPSIDAADFARKRFEIEIYSKPVEELEFPNNHFDLIAMFHVLEHIRNPKETLTKVREMLKDDGLVFLEVPNVYKMSFSVWEFLFHTSQHLYNFSPTTLSNIFSMAGLDLLYIHDHPIPYIHPSNLRTIGKKSSYFEKDKYANDYKNVLKAITEYRDQFENLKDKITKLIKSWQQHDKKILIYGAGFHTEGLTRLVDFRECNVIGLTDDDSRKWGKSFLDWEVFPPEEISNLNVDVILISSSAFRHEIRQRLTKFGKKGIEIVDIYE